MKAFWILLAALLIPACGSFFQDRVARIDAKIEAAEAKLRSAETQREVDELSDQLEALAEERRAAMGGALQESRNKQALLMALISLGAGGLKFAGELAGKAT